MCGRYRRTTKEEELARLYHVPIPKQTDLPISYNIAPSQKLLTIRFNPETQLRSLDALQWGLIPYWAKDPKIAYRTINARAESCRLRSNRLNRHEGAKNPLRNVAIRPFDIAFRAKPTPAIIGRPFLAS